MEKLLHIKLYFPKLYVTVTIMKVLYLSDDEFCSVLSADTDCIIYS